MAHAQNIKSRLQKPKLLYPFESPPPIGSALEVSPGVIWARMPLPMALNHINVWCLKGNDGWAVVDTGMRTDESILAWDALLAGIAEGKRVERVIVTHMHPDHVGLAGWLTQRFGCQLWMTQTEYLNCRVLAADTGRQAPEDGVEFYRRAGFSDDALKNYQARFGRFGRGIHALPESYRRIRDKEVFKIGMLDWRVIVGNGHSPEHACLYCEEQKLLISGDQVLPRISSNVSVHPSEPDADPMRDWLDSLAMIKKEVPDDVLVLPAHNECFYGLHSQVNYLIDSQQRTLDRLRNTLRKPCRAIDVFVALFGRAISESDASLFSLATGESLACLNYLLHRGEIKCEADELGVNRYYLPSGC